MKKSLVRSGGRGFFVCKSGPSAFRHLTRQWAKPKGGPVVTCGAAARSTFAPPRPEISRMKVEAPSILPTAADPTAAERKKDHIELALRSQVASAALDGRFFYEPMLAAHPEPGSLPAFDFLGRKCRAPLWVSSMTGGTARAGAINRNLARACREFGMGMGLGSCRQLLDSDDRLADFDLRETIGPDLPLFANLGIAQIERVLERHELPALFSMLEKLRADGLIIHVNPMQEAMQPEGDRFRHAPVETIRLFLAKTHGRIPLIIKEVGQGFGPASARALLQLPLAAIDFAAAGGTNFSKLELLRSSAEKRELFEKISAVGHAAAEMLDWVNVAAAELGDRCLTRQVIISGGVDGFLDGYFLTKKSTLPAVYGQASGFLRHAQGGYEELRDYVAGQIRGLELAEAFLKIKQP